MVRQARSEATRRKIITSAAELINEIGYPATGLGDIIERAEMTKGALYYHFDSKESLATAIIEEGGAHLLGESEMRVEMVFEIIVEDAADAARHAAVGKPEIFVGPL